MQTIPYSAFKLLTPAAGLAFWNSGGKVKDRPAEEAYGKIDLARRLILRERGDVKHSAQVAVKGYALTVKEAADLIMEVAKLDNMYIGHKPSRFEAETLAQAATSDKSRPTGYLLPQGAGDVASVAELPKPPNEKDRLAAELRLLEIVKELDGLSTGAARGALFVLRHPEVMRLISIETSRGPQWYHVLMRMVPEEDRQHHTFKARGPNDPMFYLGTNINQ